MTVMRFFNFYFIPDTSVAAPQRFDVGWRRPNGVLDVKLTAVSVLQQVSREQRKTERERKRERERVCAAAVVERQRDRDRDSLWCSRCLEPSSYEALSYQCIMRP